jgi:hypothetical protein
MKPAPDQIRMAPRFENLRNILTRRGIYFSVERPNEFLF